MKVYQKAEKAILAHYNKSKDCCAFRFQDSKDVTAQLGIFKSCSGVAYTQRNPADFIVVERGNVFFAEAKSTENVRGITTSLFNQQKGYRNRILDCGGKYIYFIWSVARCNWYKIPGGVIRECATRSWDELSIYKISNIEGVL